jgi:hypothetical protein
MALSLKNVSFTDLSIGDVVVDKNGVSGKITGLVREGPTKFAGAEDRLRISVVGLPHHWYLHNQSGEYMYVGPTSSDGEESCETNKDL